MTGNYSKYMLVHDLVRSLVWNDDAGFFDRLEQEVVDDLGVRKLTVSEREGEGRWKILYSVDLDGKDAEVEMEFSKVTGYDLPPYLLTPSEDEPFDAHFAIGCQDGRPRILSVCRADPDRVFENGELNSLITIANTVGALLDNQRLLKEDTLTGLANRMQCQLALAAAEASVQRYQRHYAVVMLDLDHFKQVNDRHGHDVGDVVLFRLGQVLRTGLRSTDFVGRWGGEEFLLVLDEAECEDARVRMLDLLREFAGERFQAEGDRFGVTFSAGVASLSPELSAAESAVSRADVAMYAAKTAGRGRVLIDAFSIREGP